jgi:hypothetical protein
MRDGWIVIPGWDKFQHYADRRPVWIRLYTELRDRDEWRALTLAEQGLLVNIWIEYASSDGLLAFRRFPSRIPQKISRRSLDSLRDAGFIEVSASKPLAIRYPRDRDRTPKSPNGEPQKTSRTRRVTGWRIVRGSHGMTTIADPNGTDPAPTIGRTL